VQAFAFSAKLGHCDKDLSKKVARHLKRTGLPTHASEITGTMPAAADLLRRMYQDKKAESGKLTFILAKKIGETFIAKGVDEASVLEFLTMDLKQK
jgi:3-dehydroquinate synthetase